MSQDTPTAAKPAAARAPKRAKLAVPTLVKREKSLKEPQRTSTRTWSIYFAIIVLGGGISYDIIRNSFQFNVSALCIIAAMMILTFGIL